MNHAESDVPPMIRQGQLIEEIARSIAAGISTPWQTLAFSTCNLASFSQSEVVLTKPGGNSARVRMPRTLAHDAVKELRAVMYRPNLGTWYQFSLTINQPGDVDVSFNYTDEPEWDFPISPHFYATDQSAYPRDEASQPEWLTAQLALSAASS